MLHRTSSVRRRGLLLTLLFAAAACSDTPTAVVGPPLTAAEASAAKLWESGASVYWNGFGRQLLATTPEAGNVVLQARLFTYMSIAQYNAVIAAEHAKDRGKHPSPGAAAAAASARILKQFLPTVAATIDAKLAEQLAAEGWPGDAARDRDAGVAIGNEVATAVIAYALTDNVGATPAPPKPVGPGKWTGGTSVTTLYGARWLALKRAEDRAAVMPPAPPLFGSGRYETDLAEVRQLALTRTPGQIATAQFWAPRNGTAMNEVAAELIVRFRRTEREAARILALVNIATFDAINACFVVKFEHYYIRPTQAEPTIALIPGLNVPNHPSYPSGHSCIVGSATGVLATEFPSERRALDAMMEEAGLSRMYAGFHFRFDIDAGQQLGRAVAGKVLQQAPAPRAAIPLN